MPPTAQPKKAKGNNLKQLECNFDCSGYLVPTSLNLLNTITSDSFVGYHYVEEKPIVSN
jgi:hypothetical protein